MVPHPRELGEVRRLVLGGARRPEEADRLAGEGGRADEVAGLARGRGDARGRVGGQGEPEARGLDLATVDGDEGVGRAEEGDDVGAAGDGAELDGGREGGVDVGEGGGGEGRARGVDGLERGEGGGGRAVGLRQQRLQGLLLEDREVLGRRAEVRDGVRVDEARHGHGTAGLEGRAVVEHDGGADREGRHEPVPHHPGGRGVVEEAAGGEEGAVQDVLFLVLQQRAEGRVDDAFGRAGGAGGVEDVEGVRGREGGEAERLVGVGHAAGISTRHGLRAFV